MKAAIFDGSPTLRLTDLPIQEPGPDEVLIRIDSATICGTDQHILEGKFWAKPPVVLGHEFAGYVERVGERVQNCKPGDLVSVEPHVYCGCCKPAGSASRISASTGWPGGSTSTAGSSNMPPCGWTRSIRFPKASAPRRRLWARSPAAACTGSTAWGWSLGDLVVILGGGAAGLILARLAELRGAARIVISEPNAARREQIRAFGYPDVVDPLNEDLAARIGALTDGLGADVVIEAAGRAETAAQAVELVCHGGRVLFFGVAAPGTMAAIEPNRIFAREITVVGSIRNPYTHHRVMEILPRLRLKDIVTHRFPLENIAEAFDAAHRGEGLKICIKPNG